ncbi:MAG TPA: oligosaccharide flippase family protein [Candidatus Saccharimonadia bacterium]
MRERRRQLMSSQFLRHNAIFVVGSLAVSFMNYLYYPVLGRLLAPADFGEVQAVISFFLQTGVLLSVLGMVTISVVKRYSNDVQRQAILGELEQLALWIGLALFTVVVLAAVPLQNFLNFTSPVPFILLALSVLLGIPGAFANAFIQAHRRFGVLSASGLVASLGKLLGSTALVIIGWRAAGAVLGVVLAQLLALAFAAWWARRLGRRLSVPHLQRPNLTLIRPELRYAGLVLVTSLAINMLLSCDIIVAKHVFSPHDAGLYAGIATVARIIYFLTVPLAAVLIASVKPGEPAHNHALLKRSLALLALLGGGTLLVFCWAPAVIVGLLVGQRYAPVAGLLPGLSLAIFTLSLANLLVYYHVALRHVSVLAAAGLGLVITLGLFLLHHGSLTAIVESLGWGSAALVGLILLITRWEARHAR